MPPHNSRLQTKLCCEKAWGESPFRFMIPRPILCSLSKANHSTEFLAFPRCSFADDKTQPAFRIPNPNPGPSVAPRIPPEIRRKTFKQSASLPALHRRLFDAFSTFSGLFGKSDSIWNACKRTHSRLISRCWSEKTANDRHRAIERLFVARRVYLNCLRKSPGRSVCSSNFEPVR